MHKELCMKTPLSFVTAIIVYVVRGHLSFIWCLCLSHSPCYMIMKLLVDESSKSLDSLS
jgi:hypothetical protein